MFDQKIESFYQLSFQFLYFYQTCKRKLMRRLRVKKAMHFFLLLHVVFLASGHE